MKVLILAACLLTSPALAQQTSPPVDLDPTQAALGAEVMECVSAKVHFRTRINQLEAELAKRSPLPQPTPEKAPTP